MKYCSGRHHNVWIIVCIFGCVTSDVKVVLCKQHDNNVHLRKIRDVCDEPNTEERYNGQSIIENSNYKDVQDRAVTADTKVNYEGNDDVAQTAYNDVIKPCNHKEHTHNSTKNINTNDVTADGQYNYNGNIDATHISTIYLAGYDDQIYKLINDIQKRGPGSELLIYFYLYTNNSYRNICYLYTHKNTLRECIAKYKHYFCVGHNKSDCICFKNLGQVPSNEKPIVQTGQELYIEPERNKIDYTGSILGKYINNEPATVELADIGSAISDSKTYYPEKKSLEGYEFILPKEKDIKFKDIYIDVLLKSQKPKALAENQIIQGIDGIKNAKSKIENKNIISYKDIGASHKPIYTYRSGAYDFNGIPNKAIETDSVMKNPDKTNILTDSLNKGKNFINNNRIYGNGITDEETSQGNTLVDNIPHVNLPGIGNVLQFKPNINKEAEDIILLNKSNMQVDGSKLEVQIEPNMEIFQSENTILRKPTTSTSNIVSEIASETSSPKLVSDKYFTYSQNSPEYNNALNAIIADQTVSCVGNEGTVSLTPPPIPEVEMNPNLEYSNLVNDAESTKSDNVNIIINPTLSNEMQINEMTPHINKIEMAANKVDVNTNEAEGRNDLNNIMSIGDKPHIHNTDNIREVAWLTPSTPTVKIHDRYNDTDKFVDTNYQSIPNSDTNIQMEPQSYENGYHMNTQPCNNINYQLINDKQHPYFHPWNLFQYGDVNLPILQRPDQMNKIGLFGQKPFRNVLNLIPRGSDVHYNYYGNEHNTIPGKLSYIQNPNLYSRDPIKGTPALNLLKPLPSTYKNIVSYLETGAKMKPETYITNYIRQQDNPLFNYNINIPQKLTASENIPLNSLRLNGLPTINQPSLANYSPLIVSDPFGTSAISSPLQSYSILSQTGSPQPVRMSNSQETNGYFTVGPKVQTMAQDVTASGLPNNANFIPTRLSTTFLNSVLPTIKSCYYKTSLPKSTFSTPMGSTYSSTPLNTYNPFSFIPVAPVKNKIEAPRANLSPSLFLPKSIADSSINIVIPYQSSSKPGEERPYASDDIYVPKSRCMSYLLPKEKSYSSNSPALSLSDLEPIVSNPFQIKNILSTSSVLPLSTLMQDKHTYSPLLSNTASYKPFSAVEASLPSKPSKDVPNLLEMGKLTNEPTPDYSDSISPTKPLEPSSNNKVLPNNIMSITPLNNLKIPYNNAMFQNIVSYINAFPPNTISPTPDLSLLTIPSNTLDIESSIDMKKSPYIPHLFPVDAKLYSMIPPQRSISFGPNFVSTKPYQANLTPISYIGGKYSTLINTQKPMQQNFVISKPAQSFEKYLISNEKLKNNMSPDILFLNTDTYPRENSKPLVLSSNYLIAPKYTDGNININPWLLSNYQKSLQPSIAKSFELLMPGNADSTVLKDSKSFIPYSCQPIGTPTLMPTLMDSDLSTQDSLSHPGAAPVQPCRFVENFATPINIISPYSYSPGKKQNKVTWIPPCIQNGDPYLQVNNINNNIASIYQTPKAKSASKEVPLKYGEDYGLTGPVTSIEVPKYRFASQVSYTEPTSLSHTANIDFLNTVPKLALQSTIPAISKLGLKTPKMWSMSKFLGSPKPSESNNEWDSFFLEQKTPKLAPNNMFNLKPSAYPQSEVTFIPSRSNEITYPSSMSNFVSLVPGFATSCKKFTSSPNKATKISLTQGISPISSNILPFNLDTASKPNVTSIHTDIFPPCDSHFHVTSPWNSSPNNLNNLWPYFIPHNNGFIAPAFGTAVSGSSVVNTKKVISSTALSTDSSIPHLASRPVLNKQHLVPYNNFILQKPLDFSNYVDQIKPILKIDDNKAYITFSNRQLLNLETSNLSPMATDTITWSNLSPSSYPQGTKPNSVSLLYDSSSSLSSPLMNIPCSPSPSDSSEKPTLPTLTSNGYLPYNSLLWKTLSLNQKPDLISHFTDTDSTKRFYASSIPQSTRPNYESEPPNNSQLNSNYNPVLSISTYLPYPYSTIKETDLNFYQNPVSNILGYYKYGDTNKNKQMAPKVLENLSQIFYTNKPYHLETSANFENLQQSNKNAMNQINYNLNNCMKQRDVINIPLNKMGLVQYEPKLCKVRYMQTSNPDIYLKIWPAAVKIITAKIVFEIDKLNALNFCPVVKAQNSQYTNEEIINVVESFVKTFYGEPITVKTVGSQKSYAVVDNIDESCIKNGKVYIVWANACDCGCNRIGCHCSS